MNHDQFLEYHYTAQARRDDAREAAIESAREGLIDELASYQGAIDFDADRGLDAVDFIRIIAATVRAFPRSEAMRHAEVGKALTELFEIIIKAEIERRANKELS